MRGLTVALLVALTFAPLQAGERRSGTEFMGPALRAMQEEESSNPATLSVLDGADLWSRRAGAAAKSCADCHGEAETAMKGVAARYPAFDEKGGAPIDIEGRINACRMRHQQGPAFAPESRDLLALSALIARQSKGLPISLPQDVRLVPFVERGKAAYLLRQGQLNLSCANCHDDHAGEKLGGAPIPEAHPTAYPVYRLEWQGLGSLQRRLRNCITGMRAEVPAFGTAALVELELYLMGRARGMPHEGPGVRP